MARPIPPWHRIALDASASGDVVLMFAEITARALLTPIRVVSEGPGGVSTAGGTTIGYRLGGVNHVGVPYRVDLLTDDESAPRATIVVPNIDRRIGTAALLTTEAPRLDLRMALLSDWALAVDADNARSPIATPTVLWQGLHLSLRNVRGSAVQIEADISGLDLTSEPWPAIRTTPDRTPALYR
ncbi:hypothetical protein [Blastochloris tepida]|uniref:Uncharacterized protein n=1 Tax=Blastochloris tepida TaxID=2233851 RepID=A0A348G1F3_9HYPH|nr:hypothetical protein [Blastochloris tepida]BBF93386.1 hypothetical protein BLTE_20710 [Blastochloris tepida]